METEKRSRKELIDEIETLKSEIQRLKSVSENEDIIEYLMTGILYTDSLGTIVYANNGVLGITGIDPNVLLGKSFTKSRLADVSSSLIGKYELCLNTKQPVSFDKSLISLSGNRKRFISGWIIPRFNNDEFKGIILTIEDVTRFTLAERSLKKQSALVAGINKLFLDTFTCETVSDVALSCLSVAEDLTGGRFGFVTLVDSSGQHGILAASHDREQPDRMQDFKSEEIMRSLERRGILEEVFQKGKIIILEDPSVHPDWLNPPDGHPLVRSFLGVPMKKGEKIIGIIGLANKPGGFDSNDGTTIENLSYAFLEVLSKKQTEENQIAEREWFETTLKSIGDAVITTDNSSKVTFMNSVAGKLTGWSRKEAEGKDISRVFNIINEFTREPVENPVGRVIKEGRIIGLANHTILTSKDGREIPIDDSGSPIKAPDGSQLGAVLVFRDVTERKNAETMLRNIAEKNRALLDAIPDMMFHLDRKGNFITYKASRGDLLVAPEKFLGKNITEVMPPEIGKTAMKSIERLFDTGEIQIFEYELSIDGVERFFEARMVSCCNDEILAIIRDMTEKKKAEQQLMSAREKLFRKEKLAVLGQLAGGIGHELRNPLGVIRNSAFYIGMILDNPPDKVREHLDLMEKEILTANSIISNLLDFSKLQPVKANIVTIKEIIDKALNTVIIPEGIELEVEYSGDPGIVNVDELQIHQVLLNLLDNAIQAVKSKGKIFIHTSSSEKEVIIDIADDGTGIPEVYIDRVFEPLFTTRSGGIGLGLAISKYFIETNGGELSVKSNEGNGSVFSIKLPVVEAELFDDEE